MKVIARAIAALALLAGAPAASRAEDAPVAVGVIANLTGSDVQSSVDMVRGVELARVKAAP